MNWKRIGAEQKKTLEWPMVAFCTAPLKDSFHYCSRQPCCKNDVYNAYDSIVCAMTRHGIIICLRYIKLNKSITFRGDLLLWHLSTGAKTNKQRWTECHIISTHKILLRNAKSSHAVAWDKDADCLIRRATAPAWQKAGNFPTYYRSQQSNSFRLHCGMKVS